jgi:molybdate transport system regulatory protein
MSGKPKRAASRGKPASRGEPASRPRLRLHLWLENEAGEALFGPGRLEILRAIETHGSLLAAASALGMSYRGLWAKVRHAERRLGFALVDAHAGRGPASGAVLTDAARELMDHFARLQTETARAGEAALARLFARADRSSRATRSRRAHPLH